MKKFIVSILGVSVFCIGLGALVERAGASVKSDEKAIALIKQARLAIGGEQSIAEVRSMIIKGNTTVTFKIDGTARTENGETEIAMQLPDKLSKMVKIGRHEGGEPGLSEQHDVMVFRREGAAAEGEKHIMLRKTDGTGNEEIDKVVVDAKDGEFVTSDGKKVIVRRAEAPSGEKVTVSGSPEHGKHVMIKRAGDAHAGFRQNELLRTTLALLATPPVGMDVNYTYAGERDVDGTTCSVVNAEFAGSSVTLYLSKVSSLPVMISYKGHAMPTVMKFRSKAPENGELKDKVTFTHKVDAPGLADVEIRFADYRSTGGVQLPYKWTTSVGGQTTEVFDVTGYEINPANIADKFKGQKVMLRKKAEGSK